MTAPPAANRDERAAISSSVKNLIARPLALLEPLLHPIMRASPYEACTTASAPSFSAFSHNSR